MRSCKREKYFLNCTGHFSLIDKKMLVQGAIDNAYLFEKLCGRTN